MRRLLNFTIHKLELLFLLFGTTFPVSALEGRSPAQLRPAGVQQTLGDG